MPLSADVETSDFPTLDEVEQMAIAGALRAHGNKPDKLPNISNPMWKLNADEEEINTEVSKNIFIIYKIEKNKKKNVQLKLDENKSASVGNSKQASADLKSLEPLPETVPAKKYIGQEIPVEFLKKAGMYDCNVANSDSVEPIYNLSANGETIGRSYIMILYWLLILSYFLFLIRCTR